MNQANFWQSKPWWCQPWSILLTGILVITGSWWLFHRWWLTMPITGFIGVWWTYFLLLVPQAIAKMAQTTDSKIEP